MKNRQKSLLPKKAVDRDALSNSLLNIQPRLKGLKRLTNIFSKIALIGLILVIFNWLPLLSPALAQESPANQQTTQTFPGKAQLPFSGYLSNPFSAYHPGIDLAARFGTPIHPIFKGTVSEVYFDNFDYGHHVIIDHGNGFKSLYAHMNEIFVKPGQLVDNDSVIGTVGLTGHTSGPHTHIEITYNGQYLNPLTILPNMPKTPQAEFLDPATPSAQIIETQPTDQPSDLHKNLQPDFTQ